MWQLSDCSHSDGDPKKLKVWKNSRLAPQLRRTGKERSQGAQALASYQTERSAKFLTGNIWLP